MRSLSGVQNADQGSGNTVTLAVFPYKNVTLRPENYIFVFTF